MVTGKKIVIDGKGHVVGRLAAFAAKAVREGHEVVILRAEGAVFSSPLERMIKIYKDKERKRCLVNPKKGPFHFKEPSKAFRRVVRGMLNYKGATGARDFARVTVFDGIPVDYEEVERCVLPRALAKNALNPVRKSCTFGEVCTKIGWNHAGLLEKFEEQRKKRVEAKQKEAEERKRQEQELVESEGFKKELASLLSKIE